MRVRTMRNAGLRSSLVFWTNPNWDFSGAVDDMRLLAQLAWRIAAQQEMPRYNDGDQFANVRKRSQTS